MAVIRESESVWKPVLDILSGDVQVNRLRELIDAGTLQYHADDKVYTHGEPGVKGSHTPIRPDGIAELINDYISTAPTDPGVDRSQSTDTTQTTTGPVPAVETTITGDDNMTHDDTKGQARVEVEEVADSLLDKHLTLRDIAKAVGVGTLGVAGYAVHESGLVDMIAAAPEGVGAVAGYFLAERFGNKRGFGTVGSIATRVAGVAAGVGLGRFAELGYEHPMQAATIVGATALAGVGIKYRSTLANVVEAVAGGAWSVAKGAWNHKGKIALGVVGAGSIALCAGYGGDAVDAGSNVFSGAKEYIAGLFAHEEQADGVLDTTRMYDETAREIANASEGAQISGLAAASLVASYGDNIDNFQVAGAPEGTYQLPVRPCNDAGVTRLIIGDRPFHDLHRAEVYDQASMNIAGYTSDLIDATGKRGEAECFVDLTPVYGKLE